MIKKLPIKLIILDFHGTILLGSMRELCQWLAKRHQLPFEKAYRMVYWDLFGQAVIGKITEREFFKRSAKLFPGETWQKLRAVHLGAQKLNRPMFKLALELQNQGYAILLLSKNTRPQFWEYQRRFQLKKYFSHIINTVNLGLPKASRQTMEYIFKRFKVKGQEVVLMDDQSENLVEAKKLGVHVIHYKKFEQAKRELNTILLG